MKCPLCILHWENDSNDAAFLKSTLEAEGITCAVIWVRDRDHFFAVLEHGGIDLIISDLALSECDGLSASAAVRARWSDLPIILVSRTTDEKLAVASLKSGATDYVLRDHLFRLAPAVRRAIQEVEDRAEHGRLEAQIVGAQIIELPARRVAHDLNNILTIIISYNDLIISAVSLDSPLRKYAEEIQHASERAACLTRQLLTLGREKRISVLVK
jgi:DNA-binding response OmpR family regulator